MSRRIGAALLLTAAVCAPASGQTIVDTFHQLRSTLGQIGGRHPGAPSTPPLPAGTTVQGTAASPAAEADDAMVPASAIAGDASDTTLEHAPLVPGRVSTFDVRGMKLGMSPREVARIAGREGFRRRWNDALGTSGDFEAEATAIADRRLARPVAKDRKVVVTSASGADASGASLVCEWTLEPAGPSLSRLVYSAKLDGSSRKQTDADLIRKYGAPTSQGVLDGVLSWANTSKPIDNASPTLIAIVGDDRLTLTLEQSPDHRIAMRDRLQARAQEIAAARGSGVRF